MKRLLAPVTILLALAACSEAPKPAAKKEPPKPLEPITGRHAFHSMYAAARGWAADIQGLQLKSIQLPEVKAGPGTAGAWQAIFVSPSRGRARTYTWSAVESPGNLHKGVFAGPEETYTQRGQVKPFLIAALKTDSDEVYKTALAKSAEYVKKNPDLPINLQLELTAQFPNPSWRVIWGESISRSNYSILVDASTGDYKQTLR
ncbi:MAG: hypothetical protein HY822_13330 [Acidobacteria bacterium]|nr:hypothetical protein [Acidobacteriota bacterium]